MSSNSKGAKRQSLLSNEKQVEVGSSSRERGAEEVEAAYEKELESASSVTNQLCIKPSQSSRKLDKEVVLRRIRQRNRMNKVRAAVGAILSSPFSTNTGDGDASVREKRWVDDAFAAL